VSEKVISRQKKYQQNNNRPSSDVEWYKLFGCRKNDPSQIFGRQQTPPPRPPSLISSNYLVGILGVSSYVV